MSPPPVSLVVIGRNEGPRLERCLRALRRLAYPPARLELLYVDSASTDGSARRARRYADRVLVVALPRPAAGAARNVGWRAARHDLVHFVDGDVELAPDWLAAAAAALNTPRVFCVTGALRERHAGRNFFHRAHDLEWRLPPPGVTEVRTCGGTALMRRSVLAELGGFDERLVAGEEPELCTRARLRGYRLLELPRPMGEHDLGMTTLRAYWRRGRRSGYAYAEIALRFRRTALPLWWPELRRDLSHLAGAAFLTAAGGGGGGLPGALGLPLGAALFLVLRKFRAVRPHAPDIRTALAYALHVYLAKFPRWVGEVHRLLAGPPRPVPPPRILAAWRRRGEGGRPPDWEATARPARASSPRSV